MELSETLRRIQRLRWKLLKPVQSFLVGPYRSTFRGEGIEFADARPYEIGDDWRRIHWSLTARKNQPYLRLGQEERELTCIIAIDRSASMHISPSKKTLTLTTAVALALSAILNNDRVRWISFSDKVEWFSPARKGEKLVWGYLAHLWQLWERPSAVRRSLLYPFTQWLDSVHKRRVFLILLSDLFFHDKAGWVHLKALSQKHAILLAAIRAPEEAITIPWGYLPSKDVETGEAAVLHGSSSEISFLPHGIRLAFITSADGLIPSLRKALLPPL